MKLRLIRFLFLVIGIWFKRTNFNRINKKMTRDKFFIEFEWNTRYVHRILFSSFIWAYIASVNVLNKLIDQNE